MTDTQQFVQLPFEAVLWSGLVSSRLDPTWKIKLVQCRDSVGTECEESWTGLFVAYEHEHEHEHGLQGTLYYSHMTEAKDPGDISSLRSI